MLYAGTLNSSFTDIAFEPDASTMYAVSNSERLINVYNGDDFSLRETMPTAGLWEFIFKQGSKLILLLDQPNKMNMTGLQLIDIVDNPPTVSKTDPVNNSVDLPLTQQINIAFSENIQMGELYTSIILKDSKGNSISTNNSISGDMLNIKPVALDYSTTYTLTIPAGAVKDAAGNILVDQRTFSFVTAKK